MSLDTSMAVSRFADETADDFGSQTLRSIHSPSIDFHSSKASPKLDDKDDLFIRSFDLTISIAMLFLLLPVFVIVLAIISASSRGPAIFVQQRVGREGRAFPCFKFRTMVVDAEERLQKLLSESEDARIEWATDQKLRNDPRITAIGYFLRKTSLDELPQILNIVAGHMSIVGPRPIVASEIVKYGHDYAAYCKVRPGLTGLWQISGRNDTSYAERVELDVRYVESRNLKLNIEICFKTVPALISARGCY